MSDDQKWLLNIFNDSFAIKLVKVVALHATWLEIILSKLKLSILYHLHKFVWLFIHLLKYIRVRAHKYLMILL